MNINNSKPCLVQTPQGFSVSYKERFLYSKYNPSKAIIQTIQNTSIKPQTLILCCSPVLNYGINELSSILPENCYMLLCESDKELLDFHNQQNYTLPSNCSKLSHSELFNLPALLQKSDYILEDNTHLPPAYNFKYIMRIDFSAGTSFNPDFYNMLQTACISAIKTFWANRITLTKFGRRYSKNFFVNLKSVNQTTPIENFFSTVDKPILIFGAGESINTKLLQIKEIQSGFYIICVDTALVPLLKAGIHVDAVFIEEAQSVILKSFIGTQNYNFHIFAGLSSIPSLTHIFKPQNISFFTTLYTDSAFIRNMQANNLLPYENKPLGSVGLTAVSFALKFRKEDSVPIYLFGLDFSYSLGITHAKETIAHKQRLLSANRLISPENYNAAFGPGTFTVANKKGQKLYTSENLYSYSQLFKNLFSNAQNLFDATSWGIDLNLPEKMPQLISEPISTKKAELQQSNQNNTITDFLKNEKADLEKLRDILSGKINLPQNERNSSIELLAKSREYLYLHFPDGYAFSMNLSFLKRLRTEIDYFLKYM